MPCHAVPHPPTDCVTPCGRKATTPTQCGSRFRMQGRLGRNNLSDPGQLYASHSLTRGGHANRAKPWTFLSYEDLITFALHTAMTKTARLSQAARPPSTRCGCSFFSQLSCFNIIALSPEGCGRFEC